MAAASVTKLERFRSLLPLKATRVLRSDTFSSRRVWLVPIAVHHEDQHVDKGRLGAELLHDRLLLATGDAPARVDEYDDRLAGVLGFDEGRLCCTRPAVRPSLGRKQGQDSDQQAGRRPEAMRPAHRHLLRASKEVTVMARPRLGPGTPVIRRPSEFQVV